MPHVVILYSGKLCSVDMPPALNKPVAAPGGGALNTDSGRRGGWRESCQAGRCNQPLQLLWFSIEHLCDFRLHHL